MNAVLAENVKAVRSAGRRYVLFNADTGACVALNATAARIVAYASRGKEPAEIGRCMAAGYGVSVARATGDAARVLARLARKGFVRRLHHAAAPLCLQDLPGLDDGPLELDISITGACNASCGYCSYAPQMRRRPDLPGSEWTAFFRGLSRLPTRRICLSGGEVFLRPDIWELLDTLLEQPVRYSVLTNGTRLDAATVRRLCEGRRRHRLDSIQVSLDGSCAAVHERTRGPGTFRPAVRALRLLREAGLPVTCRLTVNRYNVHDLEAAARLVLDDIGVRTLGTNEAMPQGAGWENRRQLALPPAQRPYAMETLERLARRYPGRVVASAGPLAQARMFAAMRRARNSRRAPAGSGMGRLSACGCVFNKLAVLHDGVIVPCTLLPDAALGRINRDDICVIWKNHRMLRMLRARCAIPLRRLPGCRFCTWADVCNGGCPALAYELTGRLDRPNPLDCYRQFLKETGHAGP